MARLDTGWHGNPKILKVGLAAMGLHAWSISYCDDALSDGFVPDRAWPALAGAAAAVRALVGAGLWIPAEGGFRLHDYTDYNRTRAQVEAYMAAKVAAGRAGGQASATARAQAHGRANGKQTLKQNPTPGPGPFNSLSLNAAAAAAAPVTHTRAHEELLAEHLRRIAEERAASSSSSK